MKELLAALDFVTRTLRDDRQTNTSDALRAEITRRKLKDFPDPHPSAAAGDAETGDEEADNWNDE